VGAFPYGETIERRREGAVPRQGSRKKNGSSVVSDQGTGWGTQKLEAWSWSTTAGHRKATDIGLLPVRFLRGLGRFSSFKRPQSAVLLGL